MKRYRRPASAVRRIRNRLLPGAGAATALIVAWAMTTSGTLSLWQDRHIQLNDLTVSAGTAEFDVDGFRGLDFDYVVGALTTQATIEIENTGTVPLSGFEATRSNVSGNADVTTAPTVSFTPLGGGASTDWDGWLEGLTLAPGATVEYVVTTTLSPLDFARLALQDAVTEVTIRATAGTGAWQVSASDTYMQAVAEPLTPGWDDFNMTFQLWSTSNIAIAWVNPPHAGQNSVFQVKIDGTPLNRTDGSYWNPAQSIDTSMVPQSSRPADGQSRSLEITVTMDGAIIARGTVWITGIGYGNLAFSLAAPLNASAPLAMSAPIAPSRAAAPAPAAPTAPAPTPTPEPVPEPEPEPPVVVTPETPDMTVEYVQNASKVVLTWAHAPDDATKFTLKINGEESDLTPSDGSFTVTPEDIPTDLWNEDGTVTELTFTIVATMPDGSEVTAETDVTMTPPPAEPTDPTEPGDLPDGETDPGASPDPEVAE